MKRKLAVWILMFFAFTAGAGLVFGQDKPAPAPAAAVEAAQSRGAGFDGFSGNGPRSSRASQGRYRRHGLDADLCGLSPAYDARPRAFLRGDGPGQECPGNDHAQLHHHRRDQRPVGAFRVQPGVRTGPGRNHRQFVLDRIERRRPGSEPGLRGDRPSSGLHDLPGHVRDHHPGSDHGRHCRTDEVQNLPRFHCPLGHFGV